MRDDICNAHAILHYNNVVVMFQALIALPSGVTYKNSTVPQIVNLTTANRCVRNWPIMLQHIKMWVVLLFFYSR